MRVPIIVGFLLVLILPSLSIAQVTTGQLEGRILDDQGQPVVGAEVRITGVALQGERLVSTRSDGRFSFPALAIGSYQIQFGLVGQEPLTLEDVRVRLGQTTDLGDIQLTDQVYVMEDLVVTGRAPMINSASTELGGNLVDDEFMDLPIDRDYRSIAVLLPHVNVSYFGDGINFAGGTGLENKYFIDGVDNTDMGNGGPGTSLPYNFVKEVQVRAGGYQAEYRGALGGAVNAVTRSGGNEFHGQVFGFFVNNNLTADPLLATGEAPRGDFAMYDLGASFGGAIKRDKLWYFAAYNPTTERENLEVASLGTMESKTVSHRFAGKLNWRLNQNNDLVLSMFSDPTKFDGPVTNEGWHGLPTGYASSDPLLYESESGGYTIALNGQHWLGDNFLLETDLSGFWRNRTDTPATVAGREELYFYDAETGIVSGGAIGSGEDRTEIFAGTAGLSATLLFANHTFKSGIEYRNKRVKGQGDGGSLLIRTYDPTEGEFFRYQEWGGTGTINNRTPSAYVQDSWRIGSRWRLNLGVRWDGEYLIDSNGQTAQTITDEWQPRLGFTFQPGQPGKHQIFGSAGRFYQELAMAALGMFFNEGTFYNVYAFGSDPRLGAPADTLDRFEISSHIQDEDEGMKGQYYDEITLGYDRRLGNRSKITVRGVYRTLGDGLEDGFSEDEGNFFWGNPGRGKLSDLPAMERDYRALELTFLHTGKEDYHFLASYVWSRTHGNYSGIWPPEYSGGSANGNAQWDAPDQIRNGYPYDAFSTGRLPNDRPHVFKASGAYEILRGLKLGSSFTWMSGTPLNEFGASSWDAFYNVFLTPRGEVGRTPAIWDLGLRISYSLRSSALGGVKPRFILDLLHIGSPRTEVNYDQRHFSDVDPTGNQITQNPSYGQAIRYQPPMTVRIGLEVDF